MAAATLRAVDFRDALQCLRHSRKCAYAHDARATLVQHSGVLAEQKA